MSLQDRVRQQFDPRELRDAFALLNCPRGSLILAWLADACNVTHTTWTGDRDAALVAEGRRQVFLLVQDILNLNEKDLRDLLGEVADRG